jgi:hypothetical protein
MKNTRHRNHRTSDVRNVGRCLTEAQGSGQSGREPPTKPQCLRKGRLGRRSLRTGKPSTRAPRSQRSPRAQALSFSKLLAQRSLTRTEGNGPVEVGARPKQLRRTAQEQSAPKCGDLSSLLGHDVWLRVAAHEPLKNQGSKTAGIDGMTPSNFLGNWDGSLTELQEALQAKTFEPLPVRRVDIPKANREKKRP